MDQPHVLCADTGAFRDTIMHVAGQQNQGRCMLAAVASVTALTSINPVAAEGLATETRKPNNDSN